MKITLNNISAQNSVPTAASTINSSNDAIETAIENTLSRDGTSPNQMESYLDMNSNRILNLPSPVSNSEPLRLIDLNEFLSGGSIATLPPGGATGSVLTKNSSTNYDASWAPKDTSLRTVLIANRSYYVRSDGSDSNTGLADNAAGAWLTKAHAINVIQSTLDLNGFTVTVFVRAGADINNGIAVNGPFIGDRGTNVIFQGDTVTPTNCIINGGSSPAIQLDFGAGLKVSGFKVTSSGSNSVVSLRKSNLFLSSIDFGTSVSTGAQLYASREGYLQLDGNFTVSAGATTGNLIQASHGGNVRWTGGNINFTQNCTYGILLYTDGGEITETGGGSFSVSGGKTVTYSQPWRVTTSGGFIQIEGLSPPSDSFFPSGGAGILLNTAQPTGPSYTLTNAASVVFAGTSGFAVNNQSNTQTLFNLTNAGAPSFPLSPLPVSSGGTGTTSAGQLPATATNDNAGAGKVGEYVSSTVTGVALTTLTVANITSISLTAGDWDVSANAYFTGNASTTVMYLVASIGTASVTNTTDGCSVVGGGATLFNSLNNILTPISPVRISVNTTTTVYLVGLASFGVSTCAGNGTLRARRVR